MSYRCPRCGTTSLPPAYQRVIAEFEALSERERSVARNLLSGLSLYGMPSTPDWPNEISDALRTLLPSFWDAKDIGDIEALLTTDPDDIEDLERWTSRPSDEACRSAAWAIYERIKRHGFCPEVEDPDRLEMIQRWATIIGNACDESASQTLRRSAGDGATPGGG